jgi:hypothetical protein
LVRKEANKRLQVSTPRDLIFVSCALPSFQQMQKSFFQRFEGYKIYAWCPIKANATGTIKKQLKAYPAESRSQRFNLKPKPRNFYPPS